MTKMLIDRSTVEQALEALQAAANFFANIDLHESFNPPTANFGSQVEELLIAAEPTLRAALAEPVQEPVAKVELMTTGGNAGLATRIVEIDDHLRERLRPGQLLYTTPPQRPAEPVQEPVYLEVCCDAHPKWMRVNQRQFDEYVAHGWEGRRLYTTPPQRKPLTEEEIQAAWDSVDMRHPRGNETRIAFARAVERAHGIGGEE